MPPARGGGPARWRRSNGCWRGSWPRPPRRWSARSPLPRRSSTPRPRPPRCAPTRTPGAASSRAAGNQAGRESGAMAAAIKEGFRLAPAQRGLLQADGTALDRRARAVAILHGPVAVDRWCAAIRQLVGEQEILRTRIGRVDGLPAPVQRIDESAGVEIAVGADVGWEALERHPGQGAVLRTSLSPTAGGGWRWRISLPLPNADRRGLVNLAAAVGRRYAGLADELPQYAAVGEWQQELLVGEETAAGRRFWQERRPSLGEPLALRAPVGGGARACRSLDGALWQRLLELAGEWGISPELVALAGWQALAARQAADPGIRSWLEIG